MSDDTARLEVLVPQQLKDRLTADAAAADRSVSAQARVLLSKALDEPLNGAERATYGHDAVRSQVTGIASASLRELISKARSEQEAAAKLKASVTAEIEEARRRHVERMDTERDHHRANMEQREADVAEKEKRAAEHLKAAQEHEAAAAQARGLLERKLKSLAETV
jgi:hypothetical protein